MAFYLSAVIVALIWILSLQLTIRKQGYIQMEMLRRQNGWTPKDMDEITQFALSKHWPNVEDDLKDKGDSNV